MSRERSESCAMLTCVEPIGTSWAKACGCSVATRRELSIAGAQFKHHPRETNGAAATNSTPPGPHRPPIFCYARAKPAAAQPGQTTRTHEAREDRMKRLFCLLAAIAASFGSAAAIA